MVEVLFLLACFAPPVTVLLSVAAFAIGASPQRTQSAARLHERHA
jgi:hypothetical protein